MYYIEILISLGMGGVLLELTRYFIRKWQKQADRKDSISNVYDAFNEVYSMLNKLNANLHGSTRVLVLDVMHEIEDDGKEKVLIFDEDAEVFSSVLYESYDYPFTSVRNTWQHQRVDPEYIEILKLMEREDFYVIKVEELTGILKDLYIAHGVKVTYLHPISRTSTRMMYIATNFREIPENHHFVRDQIRITVNKLHDIFERKLNNT